MLDSATWRTAPAPDPNPGGASEKGIARIWIQDGSIHTAEIHWYEAHGIGRKEYKIKRLLAWRSSQVRGLPLQRWICRVARGSKDLRDIA